MVSKKTIKPIKDDYSGLSWQPNSLKQPTKLLIYALCQPTTLPLYHFTLEYQPKATKFTTTSP